MATPTQNLIPGASWLGACLSVFDMTDPGRLARQLFDLGTPGSHKLGTQTYVLPANVTFLGTSGSTLTSKLYTNASEFSADYRARAKLTGKAGGASGTLQVKWQQLTSGRDDRDVVDVSMLTSRYELELTHRSANTLAADVRSDPLYTSLPDTFTQSTRHAFFSFFMRYGTHYVSRVQLGGEMHYYCILESSKTSDEFKVEAEAKFEYAKAFGFEGDVQAVTIDKDWATSRQVQIDTRPASDISAPNSTGTPDPTSDSEYKKWLVTVQEDPAVLGIGVTPIAELFDGAKRSALLQATDAFSKTSIYAATALPGGSPFPGRIFLAGQEVTPRNSDAAAAIGNLRCWQVVVDTRDLTVKLSNVYAEHAPPLKISGDILTDITPYLNDDGYVIVLTTYVRTELDNAHKFLVTSDMGAGGFSPRQKQYLDVLRGMGAGAELDKATTFTFLPDPGHPGGSYGYVFVGVSGSGPVSRQCVEVCSFEPMGKPPTTDAVNVLLEPVDEDGIVTYTPIFES